MISFYTAHKKFPYNLTLVGKKVTRPYPVLKFGTENLCDCHVEEEYKAVRRCCWKFGVHVLAVWYLQSMPQLYCLLPVSIRSLLNNALLNPGSHTCSYSTIEHCKD